MLGWFSPSTMWIKFGSQWMYLMQQCYAEWLLILWLHDLVFHTHQFGQVSLTASGVFNVSLLYGWLLVSCLVRGPRRLENGKNGKVLKRTTCFRKKCKKIYLFMCDVQKLKNGGLVICCLLIQWSQRSEAVALVDCKMVSFICLFIPSVCIQLWNWTSTTS